MKLLSPLVTVLVLIIAVGWVASKISGHHHAVSPRHHHATKRRSVHAGPSAQEVQAYRNEYGLCKGITTTEMHREYGFPLSETAAEMISKMERGSYYYPLEGYAFDGCIDAYYKRPMRKFR